MNHVRDCEFFSSLMRLTTLSNDPLGTAHNSGAIDETKAVHDRGSGEFFFSMPGDFFSFVFHFFFFFFFSSDVFLAHCR
jgi:hypothetical protein